MNRSSRIFGIAGRLMELVREREMSEDSAAWVLGATVPELKELARRDASWSVQEYAELHGVTRQTIHWRIREGRIRGAFQVKCGSRHDLRIPKDTP